MKELKYYCKFIDGGNCGLLEVFEIGTDKLVGSFDGSKWEVPTNKKCEELEIVGDLTPTMTEKDLVYLPHSESVEESWEESIRKLAKEHARASYLHSEENYPKELEENAINNLIEAVRHSFQERSKDKVGELIERLGDNDALAIFRSAKGQWEAVKDVYPEQKTAGGSTPTEALEALEKEINKK